MTTPILTAETITAHDLRTLQAEADAAGDTEISGTCELAIYGVPADVQWSAAQECADAINAARAMAD